MSYGYIVYARKRFQRSGAAAFFVAENKNEFVLNCAESATVQRHDEASKTLEEKRGRRDGD
jgi:hypothetical protein